MAIGLNNLKAPKGASREKKRVGRGESSGWGKTSTRGHKGQKARKSGHTRVGFEGGQMPLQRRLPKRGFKNLFTKRYAVINISDLSRFEPGSTVDVTTLQKAGLVNLAGYVGVKLLGNGEIDRSLTIRVHRYSESARAKVETAGGVVEVFV